VRHRAALQPPTPPPGGRLTREHRRNTQPNVVVVVGDDPAAERRHLDAVLRRDLVLRLRGARYGQLRRASLEIDWLGHRWSPTSDTIRRAQAVLDQALGCFLGSRCRVVGVVTASAYGSWWSLRGVDHATALEAAEELASLLNTSGALIEIDLWGRPVDEEPVGPERPARPRKPWRERNAQALRELRWERDEKAFDYAV